MRDASLSEAGDRVVPHEVGGPVKRNATEFSVQASNAAHRTAATHGAMARQTSSVFLAEVAHLLHSGGRAG
jgi:hypothetical protein